MHQSDHKYRYYKVEIHNLSDEQKIIVERNSYARRFVRNYFLALFREEFPNGNVPSYTSSYVSKKLTALRDRNTWLKKIDRTVLKYAVKDLRDAYRNYKDKISGPPVFHRACKDKVRFASRPESLRFFGEGNRYAHISGLSTKEHNAIDLKNHNIPVGDNIEYQNVRVSFDGHRYWLSVAVYIAPADDEDLIEYTIPASEPIGIDVGLVHSAVCSDGTFYDLPNSRRLQVYNNRIDKLVSSIRKNDYKLGLKSTRMGIPYDQLPKSKNQLKRESKLELTYQRIANMFKTHNHQIACKILKKNPKYVVIETLGFKNMGSKIPYHKLRRHIHNSRMGQLLRFIEKKCADNGIPVIRALPGFRSSQICSNCGEVHNMGLDRVYRCPNCGLIIDRDLNAAINLRNYGNGI